MGVSKGRNMDAASIEDNANLLIEFTKDVFNLYDKKIENIEKEISNLKQVEDFVSSSLEFAEETVRSLMQMSMEIMLLKVYSYAEKHLEQLLSRVSLCRKQAVDLYKSDYKDVRGVSDVEKYYYALQKHSDLPDLCSVWTDFKTVHKMRVNIEHRYVHPCYSINKDYIIKNINQAKELLIIVERSTRIF